MRRIEIPSAELQVSSYCLGTMYFGSKVPVDYTPVKNVKKPAGARPGMVIYSTCRTVNVTPEESLVKKLRMS